MADTERPELPDIYISRGDTAALRVALVNSAGQAITIPVGDTFKLTVSTVEDPDASATPFLAFDHDAALSDFANGVVAFLPTDADWSAAPAASFPFDAWWDVERVIAAESNGAKTLGKGLAFMLQDITKNP